MLHDRFSKATLEDIYHPKGNLSGSSQTLGIILTDSLQDGNFKMSCTENLSTFITPKSPIHAEPIHPGYNRITGNGFNGTYSNRYGVYSTNSTVFMGMDVAIQAMGGYNSIFGNNIYEVHAVNNSSVSADWNFWNTGDPANVIYASSTSSVTYYAPLPTDPGGGSSLSKQNSSNNTVVFDPKNVDMNDPKELQQLALYHKYNADYDEAIHVLEDIMTKFPETEYVTVAMNEVFDISKKSNKIDIESYCDNKLSSSKSSAKEKQASNEIKIVKYLRDGKTVEAEKLCKDVIKEFPNTSSEKKAIFHLFLLCGDDEKRSEEASDYLKMLQEKYSDEEETLHASELSGEEVDWRTLKKPGNENQPESEAMTEGTIPDKYKLYPAYPNPFNPSTTISFALPEASRISLEIFNVHGQKVWSALENNAEFSAGNHSIIWKGTNSLGSSLPTGIYFIKLIAENYSAGRKIMLIK